MAKQRELRCCLGCGRDTRSKTGFCKECMGRTNFRAHTERRGRHSLPPGSPSVEDDYSEESRP